MVARDLGILVIVLRRWATLIHIKSRYFLVEENARDEEKAALQQPLSYSSCLSFRGLKLSRAAMNVQGPPGRPASIDK